MLDVHYHCMSSEQLLNFDLFCMIWIRTRRVNKRSEGLSRFKHSSTVCSTDCFLACFRCTLFYSWTTLWLVFAMCCHSRCLISSYFLHSVLLEYQCGESHKRVVGRSTNNMIATCMPYLLHSSESLWRCVVWCSMVWSHRSELLMPDWHSDSCSLGINCSCSAPRMRFRRLRCRERARLRTSQVYDGAGLGKQESARAYVYHI